MSEFIDMMLHDNPRRLGVITNILGEGEETMRYPCYICRKSVTSELPYDSVIRAVLVCPECIAEGKIIFPVNKETEK